MAIVNRKVSVKAKNKKLSQAIKESIYDNKYHENNAKLLKSISLKRDIDRMAFY